MKKFLTTSVLSLSLLLATASAPMVHAAGNDLRLRNRDATDSYDIPKDIPYPTSTIGFLLLDGNTLNPLTGTFGTGLNLSSGVLSIASVPQSSVTNLVSDLAGKQDVISTGTTSQYYRGDKTWQTLPSSGISYEGTTQRTGSFPIFKSATVSSGTAVFHLTADGTSGGTTLCTNGVIQDSVNAFVSDATASYQMSYAFSNGNKTVTVTTNKLTTANILTGVLGQTQGNGSVVKLSVWCY